MKPKKKEENIKKKTSKKKVVKKEKPKVDVVKQVKKETTKKTRITTEYNKLVKLFATKSEAQKHVIEKLAKRAAFLLILSEDMEKDIQATDMLVETINASQSFIKANPLLKDYRDTIKSYQTVIKQLCDLVKNESSPEKNLPDELEQFLNN